ncbi:MAG: YicC/YloC family endoribonuclease [Planctomycetota bacterium]|nr:YicC/YloC family endoribonuclease [Planctomycetota bacterium]
MILSMTGFGDASAYVDRVHYFLEARSLNNKFFKAVIRLPENLQSLEAELETKLRSRIHRGTVTLSASVADETEAAAYEINQRALTRYIAQLEALPQVGAGSLKLDLGALLSLPGVLQPPANEEERLSRARQTLLPLLDKVIDSLIEMRTREGKALSDDLHAQHMLMSDRLAQIRVRAPAVVEEYQRRLKARIEVLLREAEVRVEPGDLIREIAVYAERTDIAEELSRLEGHLAQFRELLSEGDKRPIGRTLDFLAQEMLRETNTIASKSPDATVSRLAVEIKGAIDRIKEQAANVE